MGEARDAFSEQLYSCTEPGERTPTCEFAFFAVDRLKSLTSSW